MNLRAAPEEQLAAVRAPARLGATGGGHANARAGFRKRVEVDVELPRLVRRVGDRAAVGRERAVGLIERRRHIRLRRGALDRRLNPQVVAAYRCSCGRSAATGRRATSPTPAPACRSWRSSARAAPRRRLCTITLRRWLGPRDAQAIRRPHAALVDVGRERQSHRRRLRAAADEHIERSQLSIDLGRRRCACRPERCAGPTRRSARWSVRPAARRARTSAARAARCPARRRSARSLEAVAKIWPSGPRPAFTPTAVDRPDGSSVTGSSGCATSDEIAKIEQRVAGDDRLAVGGHQPPSRRRDCRARRSRCRCATAATRRRRRSRACRPRGTTATRARFRRCAASSVVNGPIVPFGIALHQAGVRRPARTPDRRRHSSCRRAATAASARSAAWPPARSNARSFPLAKKPIRDPSADQNGADARSVPGTDSCLAGTQILQP